MSAGASPRTPAAGAPRRELAAVSARTGRATAWAPNVRGGGSIDSMVIAGGEVVVGGHARLAAFDLRTAHPFAWTAAVSGSVAELSASGTTVYLGGNGESFFRSVGNTPVNN